MAVEGGRRGPLSSSQMVVAAQAAVLWGYVHRETRGLISIGVHLILQAAVEFIQALKVYQRHLHGCGSASAKPWDPRITYRRTDRRLSHQNQQQSSSSQLSAALTESRKPSYP